MAAERIGTIERLQIAYRDRALRTGLGALSMQERAYIRNEADAVRLNGVRIISMPIRHEMRNIPPLILDAVGSPHTTVVATEYFYPEMISWLRSPVFPYIKEEVKWPKEYEQKVQFARRLAMLLGSEHKTVAVADIANKPLYNAERDILRAFPFAVLGLWSTSLLPHDTFVERLVSLVSTFSTGVLSTTVPKIIDNKFFEKKRGIYNPTSGHPLERIIPHFEVGRRLVVAKGLRQLAKEYPSTNEKDSQILMVYPKAHAWRILDVLLHPAPVIDAGMEALFRVFGMGLNFSVRQWEKKDSMTAKTSVSTQKHEHTNREQYPPLPDWERFSERAL